MLPSNDAPIMVPGLVDARFSLAALRPHTYNDYKNRGFEPKKVAEEGWGANSFRDTPLDIA